jgi:transaldolase
MAAHAKPNACWLKSGQAVLRKPRWATLTAQGARPQRPLWASTSTKNPAYPDTVYVSSLIGPDTITTLPEATIAAFEDHGTLATNLTHGVQDAQATLERLAAVGVDLRQVAGLLEAEGVAAFANSYDRLLALLQTRPEVASVA